MSVTASEARQRLFPLIEEVNADQVAVEIVSKKGTAYLVSADEYRSLKETVYLLQSPRNAERLRESIAQTGRGRGREARTAGMKIAFTTSGWAEYVSWSGDRKTLNRINRLIAEASRDPGTGKPERLSGNLAGYWSRRIDQEHRLVYTVRDDELVIVQARYHY